MTKIDKEIKQLEKTLKKQMNDFDRGVSPAGKFCMKYREYHRKQIANEKITN